MYKNWYFSAFRVIAIFFNIFYLDVPNLYLHPDPAKLRFDSALNPPVSTISFDKRMKFKI